VPEIKIIAAVVDTTQLTLYKEDGSTITILQGDPRLKRIVDEVIEPINHVGYAMVDLTKENTYREYEQKSGGLVRFFRVAKRAVTNLFKPSEEVAPMMVGALPSNQEASLPGSTAGQGFADDIRRNRDAIQEILANAIPTSDPKFSEELASTQEEHTIVAVVKDQIIPDVDKMEGHITRAGKTDPKGMNTFMTRLSEVVKDRGHSVQDLMRFMERGDLPIADDGTIVIYKVLKRKDGHYVDCHTKKVPQKVGSYVCMDAKLVDHNRNTECSNGLHVARRGYLGSFTGDVCVIAKVHPADVITVPNYDPNKMRVCGYHILFELDDDSYSKLKSNRPFTDNPKAQLLLGRAISGDHPPPMETVTITKQNGEGVVVTPRNRPAPEPRRSEPVTKVEALSDDEATKAPPVVPTEVAKAVENVIQQRVAAVPVGGRVAEATKLFDAFMEAQKDSPEELAAAQALNLFRRSKKVSWGAIGMDPEKEQAILAVLNKKKV
jgi:hypothetical protein